jgi:hypothetical protein
MIEQNPQLDGEIGARACSAGRATLYNFEYFMSKQQVSLFSKRPDNAFWLNPANMVFPGQ